jgi:hypothetical protein
MCELFQCGPQFDRLESKWAGLRLVGNAALGVNQIKSIRPPRIRAFGRVTEFVEHRGNLDAQLSNASSRNYRPLFFVLRACENNFIFNVALHLPNIARMGFGDVDDDKIDLTLILVEQFVESGYLPPEWRSGITAENQGDGASLRGQGRELDVSRLIQFLQ